MFFMPGFATVKKMLGSINQFLRYKKGAESKYLAVIPSTDQDLGPNSQDTSVRTSTECIDSLDRD